MISWQQEEIETLLKRNFAFADRFLTGGAVNPTQFCFQCHILCNFILLSAKNLSPKTVLVHILVYSTQNLWMKSKMKCLLIRNKKRENEKNVKQMWCQWFQINSWYFQWSSECPSCLRQAGLPTIYHFYYWWCFVYLVYENWAKIIDECWNSVETEIIDDTILNALQKP